jgi:hypothetical protein
MPNVMYDASMNGWGAEFVKRRPEITTAMVEVFVTKMFRTDADFVFTVTRDFVRNCQTPVLVLPDASLLTFHVPAPNRCRFRTFYSAMMETSRNHQDT